MDIERRADLKIVNRGRGSVEFNPKKRHSRSALGHPHNWEDEIRNEISRVHALMDMLKCEADRLICDDSMHAIRVLEKNAELRELQAYYKGLRFAIDRQKECSRLS